MKAGGRLLFRRQSTQGHRRDESAAGIGVLVVEAQQMRNVQTHRAMAYTVMAGRAGHRADREHLLRNAQQGLLFGLVQLPILRKGGEVFLKLLLVRHTGQDHRHAGGTLQKTEGPGSDLFVGTHCFQLRFVLRGKVGQLAAAQGFHPDLFDSIQEMRRERNEGARLFTGIRPWASKLICGKCGNYFRIKTRHGHACWECRDSYKKENPCKNTYIYEEARNILVKELMAEVLGQRPGVVKKMKEIIGRVVTDPERREEIMDLLSGLENLIPDDDDLLMVIRSITFFPDNHIEAELVDGERISREMRLYSPGRGWYGV